MAQPFTPQKMNDIFDNLETNDFEYVLRKLTETLKILSCYEETDEVEADIQDDIDNLKEILIDVISSMASKQLEAVV